MYDTYSYLSVNYVSFIAWWTYYHLISALSTNGVSEVAYRLFILLV